MSGRGGRKPEVLAVIPARMASARLPGKPLVELSGKPLVQRVYESVRDAGCADRIIVATDDERVARAVEGFGGEAMLTSDGARTGSDRVAEVAAKLGAERILDVQADMVGLHSQTLAAALAPLEADPEVAIGTCAVEGEDPNELADPDAVKVVVDGRGRALYFSRSPIPYRRYDPPTPGGSRYLMHLGIYSFRADALAAFARLDSSPLEAQEGLEQLRALEAGWAIGVAIATHRPLRVDSPADLERARKLLTGSASAPSPRARPS